MRFVDDLIDEVEGRYCVDTRRVFAAGMSLGAGMSAVVACARPGTFGAIGLVTVEIKPPTCEPVPVIGFHGTADPVVAYDPPGGRKTTPQNVAEWVALDGCDAEPVTAPVGERRHPRPLRRLRRRHRGAVLHREERRSLLAGGRHPGAVGPHHPDRRRHRADPRLLRGAPAQRVRVNPIRGMSGTGVQSRSGRRTKPSRP